MYLGLFFKKNNINYFSKPFLTEFDNKTFISQIIRDIDFSILINLNDSIEFSIIIYPEKFSFYIANINNLEKTTFKILGKYNIFFDIINDIIIFKDFKKGKFKKKLNDFYDLSIEFSVLFTENKLGYVLSTPTIKGTKNYI
jgi:hypothetical protein